MSSYAQPKKNNSENFSLNSSLGALGFDEAEIAVYIASLALGSRPASVIAKRAGLKRTHTYNTLARLAEKGIVQEFEKSGVRYFTSRPPQALLSLFERRASEIERDKTNFMSVLPMLEQLQNSIGAKPKVSFCHGFTGVSEIYEDMITTGEHIYAVIDCAHSFKVDYGKNLNGSWHRDFVKRRAKKGIWYYGIVNQSEESDYAVITRRNEKRELRMISGFYLPAHINIYGSKVAIISTHQETVGVIIQSKPIADSLRSLHQGVWPLLPIYQPKAASSAD